MWYHYHQCLTGSQTWSKQWYHHTQTVISDFSILKILILMHILSCFCSCRCSLRCPLTKWFVKNDIVLRVALFIQQVKLSHWVFPHFFFLMSTFIYMKLLMCIHHAILTFLWALLETVAVLQCQWPVKKLWDKSSGILSNPWSMDSTQINLVLQNNSCRAIQHHQHDNSHKHP